MHGRNLLLPHVWGELLAGRKVGVTGFGCHRETGRDGQLAAIHIGQAGAFATQEGAHSIPFAADILLGLVHLTEQVDPFLTHGFLTPYKIVQIFVCIFQPLKNDYTTGGINWQENSGVFCWRRRAVLRCVAIRKRRQPCPGNTPGDPAAPRC